MARMTYKFIMLGMASLSVMQGAYAAGPAINTSSPYTLPGSNIVNAVNPLQNLTNMTNPLTGLNSMLTGQNFGQMLMNAVVTQVTSQLLGKIDPSGMLSQMAGGGMSQMLSGQGFGGLTNTGLTSNLMGGGIQSAMSGGGLNFGGLVNTAMNAAVNSVVQTAVQQVMGGIQGGSSSGGSESAYAGVSIGGVVEDNAPVLSVTSNINTTSTNFVAGQYDAAQGMQPDSRFLMVNGEYDSNYWAGYSRALASNGVSI